MLFRSVSDLQFEFQVHFARIVPGSDSDRKPGQLACCPLTKAGNRAWKPRVDPKIRVLVPQCLKSSAYSASLICFVFIVISPLPFGTVHDGLESLTTINGILRLIKWKVVRPCFLRQFSRRSPVDSKSPTLQVKTRRPRRRAVAAISASLQRLDNPCVLSQ